jgi:Protein of unknown function (DUF3209)
MACHEIAALRLSLMKILGRTDAGERAHELAELGDAAHAPGPIGALCEAGDLASAQRFFQASLSALEEKLAATPAGDPQLGYLRTLAVLTRKVELDLGHQIESLQHLYMDMEELHDFVHELYPAD